MGLEVGDVVGLGQVGQDPGVDAGVEGLDPAPEHLGGTGHVLHLEVRDAGAGEGPGRAAAGDQLVAEAGQPAGQLLQAGLVVHRQQHPHGVASWVVVAARKAAMVAG